MILNFSRRMTRGKSLKVNHIKHGNENQEQHQSSINEDLVNHTEKFNRANSKSVRIHNGQDEVDVIIDVNNKNGPQSINEAFEMNSKGSNKLESMQSQISRSSASSTPRYGSTAPMDERKLEVIRISIT